MIKHSICSISHLFKTNLFTTSFFLNFQWKNKAISFEKCFLFEKTFIKEMFDKMMIFLLLKNCNRIKYYTIMINNLLLLVLLWPDWILIFYRCEFSSHECLIPLLTIGNVFERNGVRLFEIFCVRGPLLTI